MPSKTSKKRPSPRSPWKSARACSEEGVATIAHELATQLRPGDRVLLEGPMGAGKTTFARALLHAIGVDQPPEGSPSFSIAHEYRARLGRVVHVDFYRLKAEAEIEDAGIPEYFWRNEGVVIAEWTSMWPQFEAAVLRDGRNWRVTLAFATSENERTIEVLAPGS